VCDIEETREPLAEFLEVPDPFLGDRVRAVIATEGREVFDTTTFSPPLVLSVLAASMPPFEPNPMYSYLAMGNLGTLSPCGC